MVLILLMVLYSRDYHFVLRDSHLIMPYSHEFIMNSIHFCVIALVKVILISLGTWNGKLLKIDNKRCKHSEMVDVGLYCVGTNINTLHPGYVALEVE